MESQWTEQTAVACGLHRSVSSPCAAAAIGEQLRPLPLAVLAVKQQ